MPIRKAVGDDRGQVLDFCRETFSWGDYIGEVWDKWLSTGGLYVAEEAGTVIGVYHIAFPANESWIEGMRVHPDHRKSGSGTKMMSHAESVIKKGTVRLVIESENLPSIGLVKSMGYELEEKWRLYHMSPETQASGAVLFNILSGCPVPRLTSTYPDSWRWLPLDKCVLDDLSQKGKVLAFLENGIACSLGIWGRSGDFHKTFQQGLVAGTKKGIGEILKLARNMALSLECDKIQVFATENQIIESPLLERKSLFYLMKKELGKNL